MQKFNIDYNSTTTQLTR